MSKKNKVRIYYVFGEFWNGNEEENNIYLEKIEKRFDLVDVPLHNNLHKASLDGADYDLTTIFDHSLVKNHPEHAVTFVDNHDTQRGQALESTVEEWFNQLLMLSSFSVKTVFLAYFMVTTMESKVNLLKKISKKP